MLYLKSGAYDFWILKKLPLDSDEGNGDMGIAVGDWLVALGHFIALGTVFLGRTLSAETDDLCPFFGRGNDG